MNKLTLNLGIDNVDETLLNKSKKEILDFYSSVRDCEDNVREMIRHFLSRNLMDTNENKHYKCEFPLDTKECCGLSSLDMLWVTSMWQHPSEGYITFVIEEKSQRDFDDMDTDELICVLQSVDFD
jgi:hypothetical protein